MLIEKEKPVQKIDIDMMRIRQPKASNKAQKETSEPK